MSTGRLQPGNSSGPKKEVKRKMSPIRDINGPLLANSLQRIVKGPSSWALKDYEGSPKSVGLEKGSSWDGLGKDKGVLKPNAKNSVKGKKALARARASQTNSLSAVRIAGRKNSPSSLLTHDGESQNGDEDQRPRNSPEFLFTSAPWPGTSS